MSRSHKLCALILGLAAIDLAAQTPAPQPTSLPGSSPHVYKTIGDTELRLHVFSPAGERTASSRPAIIFFFGGGWVAGTVQQFVPQSQHLAERGMIAIIADYRVRRRHQTTPFEAMADARSAIRWVRSHAKELGVDPNRLAAAGGSSGGHIAASAAVFSRFDQAGEDTRISAKPNALVLFNPPLDTAMDSEVLRERFGERGREGSPLTHLTRGLPPTLIMHGRQDTTVPYESVERFCALAKKLGDRCDLVGYDGAGHGFFNAGRGGGKWYNETLAEMDRFLTSLGYLPKPGSTASFE